MNRRLLMLALAVVVMAGAALTVMAAERGAKSPEKTGAAHMAMGKEISLAGKVSCASCTLGHPDKSCPKGCCTKCIKAGDPTLLTDASGNMYLLLSHEQMAPLMTPERIQMVDAQSQVTVKGLMVKGKGVQAIYVDSMEKVMAKTR